MRLKKEFDAELEAKRQEEGDPAVTRDEEKFEQAAELREKRRKNALQERRRLSENKLHVYALAKFISPPPLRPFDLSRDLNRGNVVVGGLGGAVGSISLGRAAAAGVAQAAAIPKTLRILFLRDGEVPASEVKPAYLQSHGHDVITPPISSVEMEESVRIAEAAFSKYRPDVVVGDSFGGAVALNMQSGEAPLVLLCPAWKKWGTATTTKPNSIILHSKSDALIPFADSEAASFQQRLARHISGTYWLRPSPHRFHVA